MLVETWKFSKMELVDFCGLYIVFRRLELDCIGGWKIKNQEYHF